MSRSQAILLWLILVGFVSSCTWYQERVTGKEAVSTSDVLTRTLVYSKPDGVELAGDFFKPAKVKGLLPTVVVIHGGGWTGGKRQQMTSICERLARSGFAVFNISYRFAPEYRWPAQRQDVEAALSYLKIHSKKLGIDLERMAAYGYSAGAHLALMLGYHHDRDKPDAIKFRAVAGGGSPVDLTQWPESELVNKLIGHPYKSHKHLFVDASPISYVRKGLPPTFLYHGRYDWIVEVEQSRKMVQALREGGVEVEYEEMYFGHVATFLFDEKEVQSIIKFFELHV